MTRLRPDEIIERVKKEGFEKVWKESSIFIPRSSRSLVLSGRGSPHPIYELIQKLRERFLSLGFDEIFNPIIIEENEIYRQYGPEAPIILDRCYYLAGLPRPDIGLSKTKCEEIRKLGVELTDSRISALKKVFREYKKGRIEPDDLIEKISEALEIPDHLAMNITSQVFPEFSMLKPEPSKLTLRSHMTSAWFLTLQSLQHKRELPLKLFSVDVRFRREQREDATHLRVHHSASCVVMDEELNVEEGERITRALLEPFGPIKLRFIRKKVSSKYYAPGMEYEGFIYDPSSKRWIEVVDYGIYNPISLARYDLEYPVLNVGLGVERLAMILYNETDVRRLVYPQFYAELLLTDQELADAIRFEVEPVTDRGKEIMKSIIFESLRHRNAIGPCQFLVYKGEVLGKSVEVYVYENEKGATLLGAAAENYIFVYDGNIVGAPKKGMDEIQMIKDARERGICTNIRYIDGVASLAAAKIEEAVKSGVKTVNIRVRMARRLSDINLGLSGIAHRFITNWKKKIIITGPVFMGVYAKISD